MCEVTQIGILLSVLIVIQLAMSTLCRGGSRAWYGRFSEPLSLRNQSFYVRHCHRTVRREIRVFYVCRT